VDTLATNYGWDRDSILQLSKEEAEWYFERIRERSEKENKSLSSIPKPRGRRR
jgi:hypothetical protein